MGKKQSKFRWKLIKNKIKKFFTFKRSVILLLVAIIVPLSINIVNRWANFNKRVNIICNENLYNMGILNSYKKAINEGNFEELLFFNNFSVETYRQNWDIINKCSFDCVDNYIKLIAKMEAVNLVNRSIVTLYNQEGLIFETNQWQNTKGREKKWKEDLKILVLEIEYFVNRLESCKISTFQTVWSILFF